MKKEKTADIGIISFSLHSDGYNFGAALHSFAFQKYLDKIGVNSVIINYFPKSVWKNFVVHEVFKNILHFQLISFFKNIKKLFLILVKKQKFYNFFKKNCNITSNQYTVKSLEKLKTVSCFVCETDVTWVELRGSYDRGFLCDLENMKNKNNIAYSIDFGSKEISVENREKLKKFSKNFKYISIRNIFKLDYFKNIVDRDDIVNTIDPVFLISKEDYLPYVKEVKGSKDYVLIYNCQENNLEMIKKAKEFAKSKNLEVKIINCVMKQYEKIEDSYPTSIGIEDFLGLVKNCKYLFSNSFHGICFSIIFEKEFFAFSRTANNDKIQTILKIFNLENRLVYNETINLLDFKNIEYSKIRNIADDMIKESKVFIDEAIKNNYVK